MQNHETYLIIGVCGLARLSTRSMVAVGSFMTTGCVTSSLLNSSQGQAYTAALREATTMDWSAYTGMGLPAGTAGMLLAAGTGVAALRTFRNSAATSGPTTAAAPKIPADASASADLEDRTNAACSSTKSGSMQTPPAELAVSFGTGLTFAGGLALSGMCDPSKVTGFLNMAAAFDPASAGWDPSLALVMGGAVGFNLPVWQYLLSQKAKGCLPKLSGRWSVPSRTDITSDLVIGSSLFGIGWGLAGVCPGPGLVGLTTGDVGFALWCMSLVAGMRLAKSL